MPCSGPNCDYAASKGDKAYAVFAEWLKDTYDIPTQGDITTQDRRYAMWNHLTIDSHKKLQEAVRDLFVSDACDSW